jgi:hypothetical protein
MSDQPERARNGGGDGRPHFGVCAATRSNAGIVGLRARHATGEQEKKQARQCESTRLMVEGRTRDLAMLNLAIDSKLRGCDVTRAILQSRQGRPGFLRFF